MLRTQRKFDTTFTFLLALKNGLAMGTKYDFAESEHGQEWMGSVLLELETSPAAALRHYRQCQSDL